ncbi:hypothetical protein [Cellulomonas rhizosphaerae]|uniref:hypothetical protein n=1 Tax=Cellulomonas rhizosphaerae TaxID=2293719 RepID=UPI001314BA75|nr:hypothetical protein [Cellulomonas rhizosphaerae]
MRVEILIDEFTTRETRRITVGRRHLYVTDPMGGMADFRWWLQRVTERIQRTAP